MGFKQTRNCFKREVTVRASLFFSPCDGEGAVQAAVMEARTGQAGTSLHTSVRRPPTSRPHFFVLLLVTDWQLPDRRVSREALWVLRDGSGHGLCQKGNGSGSGGKISGASVTPTQESKNQTGNNGEP